MSEWMNSDGSFGDMTDAPESVSSNIEKNGFKDVEALSSAYTDLYKLQGTQAEKLNIPENFSDDMKSQMLTSLGRPESADKYDLSQFKDIKPEMLENIRELAFEQGWSQDGTSAALGKLTEWGLAAQQDVNDKALKLEEEMKTEMGDKFQPFVDKALDTADKLGVLQTLHDKGLTTDRAILDAMNKLGEQIGEDSLKATRGDPVGDTKEEKMAKLKANPAMLNRMHPDHEQVHKEWLDLHRTG